MKPKTSPKPRHLLAGFDYAVSVRQPNGHLSEIGQVEFPQPMHAGDHFSLPRKNGLHDVYRVAQVVIFGGTKTTAPIGQAAGRIFATLEETNHNF